MMMQALPLEIFNNILELALPHDPEIGSYRYSFVIPYLFVSAQWRRLGEFLIYRHIRLICKVRDGFSSVSALLRTLEQRTDLQGCIRSIHAALTVRIEQTCLDLSKIIKLAVNCRDISVQAHWKPGVEDPIHAAIGCFTVLDKVRLTGVHFDGPILKTLFEQLRSVRIRSLQVWPYDNRYINQIISYSPGDQQIYSDDALHELLPRELHETAHVRSLEVHYPCKNELPALRALLCWSSHLEDLSLIESDDRYHGSHVELSVLGHYLAKHCPNLRRLRCDILNRSTMVFAYLEPWPLIDLRPLSRLQSVELPADDLFESDPEAAADLLCAPNLKSLTILLGVDYESLRLRIEKLKFGPKEKDWLHDFAASMNSRHRTRALARIHLEFRLSPSGYDVYLKACSRWPWVDLNAAVSMLSEHDIEMTYHDPDAMTKEWHDSLKRAIPIWANKARTYARANG